MELKEYLTLENPNKTWDEEMNELQKHYRKLQRLWKDPQICKKCHIEKIIQMTRDINKWTKECYDDVTPTKKN